MKNITKRFFNVLALFPVLVFFAISIDDNFETMIKFPLNTIFSILFFYTVLLAINYICFGICVILHKKDKQK